MSDERIDESQIRHIAHLSRLTLSEREIASLTRDMSAIVGYMDQLSALNTEGVPPTAHALAVRNVFRADEVQPSIDQEAALSNAPQREGPYFKVPKVLDVDGGA